MGALEGNIIGSSDGKTVGAECDEERCSDENAD
jgi:hypothetical protein